MSLLDVAQIKADFPILGREVHPGIPLIYLDSAATAVMPKTVMDAMVDFESNHRANIHRAVHTLAEEATTLYEQARMEIADFVGVPEPQEIIFTRNATEAINLVAQSWGRANLKAGDVVLLSELEHHANLVPWQILSAGIGFNLEFIPVTEDKVLDMVVYRQQLQDYQPKIVAVSHVSNVLGTVNPVEEIIATAHQAGALVLIDGAQAVPHLYVNILDLDADFYAFSGHKMLGPTGIGVLYGKKALLEAMPPFLGGGDMIKKVELRSFKANDLPYKFEAGTPAISQTIGLAAAARYLKQISMPLVESHSRELVDLTIQELEKIPGVHIFGPGKGRQLAVVSFTVEDIHPHDVSAVLDQVGVAVRAGHHCAMPLHTRFQLNATSRASFSVYNSEEDVETLVHGLHKVIETFK
ncbi:MAG: SufS family cysteine desulfurase [Anaerolineae bacterium]|jgi:cysteine desulfurase/selenocysteine lyase|nr:SufS family cysteine desulfurase [Anaerolineae bacterium]